MAKRTKPGPRRAVRSKPRRGKRQPTRRSAPAKPSAVVVAADPVPSPPPGPSPEAVRMFETAIAAVQRHRYSEAAQQFRSLLSRFPGERALLDRARAYLDHCDRELARQPAPPETIEERLTAATAALNNDDDARAEALARAVLSEEPRQDLGLYLMAAIEARRGSSETALSYLERAIAVSPEASAQARFDDDFVSLRSSETFKRLTEPPHHPTPSGRRQRRSRG